MKKNNKNRIRIISTIIIIIRRTIRTIIIIMKTLLIEHL
jgi:hypothetical protein